MSENIFMRAIIKSSHLRQIIAVSANFYNGVPAVVAAASVCLFIKTVEAIGNI